MAEPCAVCNLPIKASRIRAKGRLFHEECFQCSKCSVSLESFFFKDGKLYCDPCETELFAKKCDKCFTPIQTTLINVRGKTYHTDCFTCKHCTNVIKGGFFYIDGNFVCDKCDSNGCGSINNQDRIHNESSRPITPPKPPVQVQQQPPIQPNYQPSHQPNYQPPSYINSNSPINQSYENIPYQPQSHQPPIHVHHAINNSTGYSNTPPDTPPPKRNSTTTALTIGGQQVELPDGAVVQIPGQPGPAGTHNFIYIVNNSPAPGTGGSISMPQLLSQLRLSGDVGPVDHQYYSAGSPSITPSSSTHSLPSSNSNGSISTASPPSLKGGSAHSTPGLSSPSTSFSHDKIERVDKHIPLINGKTLPELLRTQTFDDILTNVLTNKIRVHNEIKLSELEMGDVMAAGASGKVHKGRWKGRDVAVKVYSTDNIYFSREEFDREVAIMSLLDHECFTEFYGANTEKANYLVHVAELIKGGCLRDVLLNKDIEMSYAQQVSMALDIANGMKLLHSMGVIHRDLKSGNVLVTDDMRGKVIDFGTSRAIDLAKQMTMNLGTSSWMAPEVFRNESYTGACDVYSYGIVLWEIYCRKDPYQDINSWSIPLMVTKGERPPIPADCPSDYAKLIKACWVDKAKKRPTFKEIYSTLNKIYGSLTLGGKSKKKGFLGK